MRRAVLALRAAVALLLLGFAYFVWPTPYLNVSLPADMARSSNGALCCYAARVNRFTSKVEVLTIIGWLPAEDAATFAKP